MLEKQGDSLSVKQIRGSLGLKKAATAKLKAELLKLKKAGKIAKHGTRYQKSQEITERTGSKGKNKGKQCSRNCKLGYGMCTQHYKIQNKNKYKENI